LGFGLGLDLDPDPTLNETQAKISDPNSQNKHG